MLRFDGCKICISFQTDFLMNFLARPAGCWQTGLLWAEIAGKSARTFFAFRGEPAYRHLCISADTRREACNLATVCRHFRVSAAPYNSQSREACFESCCTFCDFLIGDWLPEHSREKVLFFTLGLWDAIWDGVMVVCIKTYCRGAIHRLDGVSEPVGAIRDEGSTLIGRQRGGICPELSWQPGSFPSWKWKENIHSTVWLEWELSTGCRKKVFRLCYVFITLYKSLYVFTLLGSLAAQGLRALRVEFL